MTLTDKQLRQATTNAQKATGVKPGEIKTLGEALKNSPMLAKTTTLPTMVNDIAEKQEQRRRNELWTASGVDKRHVHSEHDDLIKHKQWFEKYSTALDIIDNGGILMLLGDRGNGKTQCGVELIRQECWNGKYCRYVRCREVGMKLREAYGKDGTLTELTAVESFVKPHLLVIDECQERMDTDFEARSFSLILDKRYGDLKPTVLIANCNQQAMRKIIGSGVCDRVKEGGGALMFDWPSFRKDKRAVAGAMEKF